MAKLWKSHPDTEGKSQLHEVELSSLAITSPTIIYLAGLATRDNQPRRIAGGIRRVEELLQDCTELSPPPQVYAWSLSGLRYVFNQIDYNLRPHRAYSADAERLARGVILPLVSENGMPLPPEEAQKRLRNLTLFGYSSGTVVAQEVFNASLHLMQKVGYQQEQARKMLEEVVLLSTGNISRPAEEKKRFTTLYLAASNDKVVCWNQLLWNPLRVFFAKHARDLSIRAVSKTSLLITAEIKKRTWEWRKAVNGTKEKKAIYPVFPVWTGLYSYHEPAHYITSDDAHSPLSRIALYTLANAVKRQAAPDIMTLLAPVTTTHTQEETRAYRCRIERAIKL